MPGSGLGLAIVQQVVEGHGGTIILGNRPGGGAVATLTLPLAGETIAAAAAGEQSTPSTQARDEQPVPMPVEESLFR